MPGLSPKFPLSFSSTDGYSLNKTMPEMIRQNLIHLFLTNPGERIMDPFFGVGLKKYLFEQNTQSTYDIIRTISSQQIKKYMPFLTLQNIDIKQDVDDGNIMYVTVYYIIAPLNQVDSINLEVRP